jgi:signal transduction histidine kinase
VLVFAKPDPPRQPDQENVREWLAETATFRKTLPELVREYVGLMERLPPDPQEPHLRPDQQAKRAELREQLKAMAEPTLMYPDRLPLFPVVYSLEVTFPDLRTADGRAVAPVSWHSPTPPPRVEQQTQVKEVVLHPFGDADRRAEIRGTYRLHTWTIRHAQQEDEHARAEWENELRRKSLFLLAAAAIAGLGVAVWLLKRERAREYQRWQTAAEAEHHERELLAARVKQQEAERDAGELKQQVLEHALEAATLEGRAAEAEKAALEMKSQLYASIGIMAGSYAHNIKNLLVRPNDLLTRCIEVDGLSPDQEGMLSEVKTTLGTVTERLQQILRTVRRDPSRAELTRIDLAALVRESERTWAGMGREKWKINVRAEVEPGPLWVEGDLSHLQQAVENLLFNARDATFEMRNHLREAAYESTGPDRRQKLLDAAAWKGEVVLRARRDGGAAVLEVQDNGIGMTEDVRRDCLKTHFTTKRDNAVYEGMSAGMGLGLSFVAVVLEHHGATLEIESEPLRGALFRVRMPLAEANGPA